VRVCLVCVSSVCVVLVCVCVFGKGVEWGMAVAWLIWGGYGALFSRIVIPELTHKLTKNPPPQQTTKNSLGQPFAAFQAATAASSSDEASAGNDDGDEDYSGEEEESDDDDDESEEEEEEDSDDDDDDDDDDGPARRRKAAASKSKSKSKAKSNAKGKGSKGTPASAASSARASSSSTAAATTPTTRLFSPAATGTATPFSAASAGSKKKAGGAGAFSDDEASVGSRGASKGPPRADGVLDYGRHTHHSLKWLWHPERRDAEKRKPEDPLYNPRTLFVPPTFLQKETPAMRQWWEFKAQNFDTILFFKVCVGGLGYMGGKGVVAFGGRLGKGGGGGGEGNGRLIANICYHTCHPIPYSDP
jgi:hypothetical protein